MDDASASGGYGGRMSGIRPGRDWLLGERADVAFAVGLTALWFLEVWAPGFLPAAEAVDQHRVALTASGMLMLLPLAARRTMPLASCVVVMVGVAVTEAVGPSPEGLSSAAGVLVAGYSVAAHTEARRAVAGLSVMMVGLGVAQAFGADDLAFAILLIGGAWAAGRTVRLARVRARELEALTEALARERGENAQLAVALERTRIARELHDVVAHSVSVMVVQAGGVRGLLRPAQVEEREALAVIESTGRQAMTELRRMLGTLRTAADGDALAPAPALSHVDSLVANVRDAGLPVELSFDGRRRPLSPGLELSAYRIVQEALTNTLKHAGPAHAEVHIGYGERELAIEVCDDGAGRHNGAAAGHGLVGMRERVSLFGGVLETGPRPSGGFRVSARFPIETAE